MTASDTVASFVTRAGVGVHRTAALRSRATFTDAVARLDTAPGVLLGCSYSHASRYREKSTLVIDPPIRLSSAGTSVTLELLKPRGRNLFGFLGRHLDRSLGDRFTTASDDSRWQATFAAARHEPRTEDERSRIPSPMTVVSAICDALFNEEDHDLGLFGAVGYDMVFHFEPGLRQRRRLQRAARQRELVLYLPDQLLIGYPDLDATISMRYEFDPPASATRIGRPARPVIRAEGDRCGGGPASGEAGARPGYRFVDEVGAAHAAFARGDLFEVVLSERFTRPSTQRPTELYERLNRANPAPYAGLLNLGHDEFLIASSPEMFLRVTGRQIESCPIAGTVGRSGDALADFDNLRALLLSDKADTELVMCTDVDRNDKSLVCEPGTVRVTAHRDVEMTSRVMHTVEHVTGELRDGFTGLDAFISHMWAVTVTGAPKLAAIDFIEGHESEARQWYAGAFGRFGFNGDLDTGITIRTIHLRGDTASVRAGSTLLAQSEAEAERDECVLKAAALLNVLDGVGVPGGQVRHRPAALARHPRHVLLVDHEDSFVHTLADYFRQEGCRVTTVRAVRGRGVSPEQLTAGTPDLVCLSPGPGSPAEFRISATLAYAERHRLPVFGVCLGAQAIAEYCGGALSAMHRPMHGIQSVVRRSAQSAVLRGLPERFLVGRYHSLRIVESALPADLPATAWSEDDTVMCVEHNHLPFVGVQFHPESIMTAAGETGRAIIRSVLGLPAKRDQEPSTI